MAFPLRVFLPKPPWPDTRSLYEGFARAEDIRLLAGRDENFRRTEEMHDAIMERLALKPSDRLLDVGCGDASFLSRVCEKVSSAVGTVLTETERDRLRAHYKGRPMEFLAVRLGDGRPLPGEYDVVVANGCLFIMGGQPAAIRALTTIADALRPGGLAWIGEIPSRQRAWTVYNTKLGAMRHVWEQRGHRFALKYARHLLRRIRRRTVFVAREHVQWATSPAKFTSIAETAGFFVRDQWSCFDITGDEFYNRQNRMSYLLVRR
jgi:SAM-dependent methyltransferase